jgi:Ca2+-binding RTX toxin-like protein
MSAEIQKLYIAYFNRPADPGGLAYWTAQLAAGVSMTTIANSFSASAEYQAIYVGKSNLVLIDQLYQNLFGRSSDAGGLLYWANEMAAGRVTITSLASALSSGTTAGSADNIAINSKISAATAFTAAIDTAPEIIAYSVAGGMARASTWLSTVTNAATLASAIAPAALTTVVAETVTAGAVAGQGFTLTSGSNTFTGSTGNDSFDGSLSAGVQTLTTGDQLSGGAGTDSLIATITGSVTPALLSSIENVTITNTALATLGMANATGTTSLNLQSAAGALTVTGLGKAVGVTLSDSAQNHTITYNDVDGSADSATVTLSNITAGTHSLLGIETLSLVASGTSNVLTALTATQATRINVSGSAGVNLGAALGTAALTVDASTATGVLTVITGASTTGQTITGGSGNDVITMGGTVADSVNGGAGNDTIVITAATLTAADTIVGGAGTLDNLVLSGAGDQTVTDAQFTLVSTVERLSGATFAQGNTAGVDFAVTADVFAKAAGIVRFSDAATEDSAFSLALGSAYNGTAVTFDFAFVADTDLFTATAAGTTAVMTFQGDADGLDANDILTGGTSSGDTLIFNSAGSTATIVAIGGIERINVTATNGAVVFTTSDTQITDATTIALVVDASAATGASTFTFATATAHAITYTGSGQVDSVTGGAHNDSLSLAAGDDVAVFTSAGLTTLDTVAGGTGNDTLSISDAATVTDVKFTNVTSVETLALANATNSVTLEAKAMAAGIATVTGGTGADTIAVSATFTGPLRVNMGTTGADSVVVTGAAVLTAALAETDLTNADVITGGTTTGDVLRLTADGGTANFAGVTAVETYLIIGDAGAVGITTADINAAVGTTLTIDASSLASGANALTVDAGLETDAKIVVTGGAGNDLITLTTTGADSISGGSGNETFTVSNTGFTLLDTIAGGVGTDNITMSDTAAVVDADFTNVTSVERLNSTATTSGNTLTATIGALAQAAGLVSIVGGTGVDTVTVGAGYTGTVRVTTTSGSDVISASATAGTLQIATALGDIDAADVWTGGTGASDSLIVTSGTATAATLAQVTAFETITTSGDAGAFLITTANVNVASGVTMTVNGASLVTTNALTFDGTAEADGKFSITGGSGADTLSGGSLADTIDGASGNDVIDGGSGNDSMTGGAGNDTITVGQAEDYADGGVGTDTLTVTAIGSGTFVLDLSASGDQLTTYNGSANATSQTNFENATFTSITGTLNATAAAGGSTITSGSGSATLTGGAGNDSLTGGAAADSLVSAAGVDTLTGGAGNDRYIITLNSLGVMDDTIVDSAGTDTLVLTGAAPTTRAAVNLTAAAFGSTVIDTLDLTGLTVAGATVTVGTLNTTVLGSDFADSVTGGANLDTISTGSGNDTITGGGSADVIDAGDGADTLIYLLSGDLFNTQASIDSITGGSGIDTLLVGTAGTAFGIANNDVWSRTNTVETITAVANSTAVTILLDVTAETAGIRTVDISATTVATTNIVDVSEYTTAGVTITTGAIATTVIGGAGGDTITGGIGADIITGNAGADSIVAGAGADRIYADNNGNKQTSTITIAVTADGTLLATDTQTVTIDGVALTSTMTTDGVSGDGAADVLFASTTIAGLINGSASLAGIATATFALGVVTVTFLKDGVHTITLAESSAASGVTILTSVTATGTVGTGGLDIINLGADAAIDKVFVGPAAAGNADTISNFTLGAGGDHLVLSLADTTGTAVAGAATGANVFTLSSTGVNASNEIIALVGATYSTAALAEAALDTYADATITATNDVIFVYSNGVDSFVYKDLNAGTLTDAGADLTLIATLTGITSLATMTSANFFYSN